MYYQFPVYQNQPSPTLDLAGSNGKKQSFPTTWNQITELALQKATHATRHIPVPAAIKKHVSRADAAFIVAAYAIPLPGTALFAAAIVASKIGYRRLRRRFPRHSALDV